ncbi:hypothetical protein C5167_015336 [Papaver somniferum]|uniref:Uncharacterized protein n=1 Tax=Papaver somniferum TaxID=3469 RepID=A0A4Y7J5R3_PAPSO|nr:hypothetical protein C5167_015336 [Papaver somniferum]
MDSRKAGIDQIETLEEHEIDGFLKLNYKEKNGGGLRLGRVKGDLRLDCINVNDFVVDLRNQMKKNGSRLNYGDGVGIDDGNDLQKAAIAGVGTVIVKEGIMNGVGMKFQLMAIVEELMMI